jgi:hypothetical protein
MKEVYKTIKNFPNYLISNLGNILNKKSGRFLLPSLDKDGYEVVVLSKNDHTTNKKIHRLVAKAFIKNPTNKEVVDHIDNNRTNNRVDNLRWVTSSENSMNRSISSKNKSGYKGVCYDEVNNKWKAYIKINEKQMNIGNYKTKAQAVEARKLKAIDLFGEFMNNCEY